MLLLIFYSNRKVQRRCFYASEIHLFYSFNFFNSQEMLKYWIFYMSPPYPQILGFPKKQEFRCPWIWCVYIGLNLHTYTWAYTLLGKQHCLKVKASEEKPTHQYLSFIFFKMSWSSKQCSSSLERTHSCSLLELVRIRKTKRQLKRFMDSYRFLNSEGIFLWSSNWPSCITEV